MDKKNLDIKKIVHCINYMKGRLKEMHDLYSDYPDIDYPMNRSVYDEWVGSISSRLQHISETYDTVYPMIELCSNIVKKYNSNQVITMDFIADTIVIHKKYVDILIENMKKCPTDPVDPKDMHTIIMNIYISTYRIVYMSISNINEILNVLAACYSIVKCITPKEDKDPVIQEITDRMIEYKEKKGYYKSHE